MSRYKKVSEQVFPGALLVEEPAALERSMPLSELYQAKIVVLQRKAEPHFKLIKHRTKSLEKQEWMTAEGIKGSIEVPCRP